MEYDSNIVEQVCDTLVKAGSAFLPDKIRAYENAIRKESNPQARCVSSV